MKFIILCLFIIEAFSKTKDEWKSRTVYQLLTDRFATSTGKSSTCNLSNYCGGDYKGIINNLDYIISIVIHNIDMGFDAIWISPIIDNYDNGYHGYWYRNMYDVNKNFGTAQDLKNLVTACHNKGVWVMVDVIANHVFYVTIVDG
jgi:alpha-amylase